MFMKTTKGRKREEDKIGKKNKGSEQKKYLIFVENIYLGTNSDPL